MEELDLNESTLKELKEFRELYDRYFSGGALKTMRQRSREDVVYSALVYANDVLFERIEELEARKKEEE